METITEIIFYSRDRKFERDLTPLLWANPYANGKYMSQQRALKSEKGHHDLQPARRGKRSASAPSNRAPEGGKQKPN